MVFLGQGELGDGDAANSFSFACLFCCRFCASIQFIVYQLTSFSVLTHEHKDTLYLCGSSLYGLTFSVVCPSEDKNICIFTFGFSLVGNIRCLIIRWQQLLILSACLERQILTLWEAWAPNMVAEQGPRRRRTYFDYLDGETPGQTPRNTSPRRTPPRSPRARSMGAQAEQEEEYEARRDERQESRRGAGGDPIGVSFRLNACEQSLRSHSDEMAAQRLMLGQITDAIQQMTAEKEKTDSKLDSVFQLVDQRFSESQSGAQEIVNGAQARFDTMTATVQAVAAEVMNRMEAINKEIEALKVATASPRSEPPRSEPYQSRPDAPPPPSSWTSGPHDHSTGGPPSTPYAPQASASAPQSHQQEPTRNMPQFGGPSPPPHSGYHGSNGQRPGFNAFARPGQPTHPSDQTSSKIPHFNMSSPGSPLNGSVPQWAPGAGTEHRPFDPRDWSVEGKKPSKELRTFDGDMAHYDNWRRRVRDHFVSTNINYSKVFEFVEKEKVLSAGVLYPRNISKSCR